MEFLSHINLQIWILQVIAMLITAILLPGLTVSGPLGALIGVVGLAFVNAHLWDAALFFSLPDSASLHAILLLLANGIIFWIVVKILPGIDVTGILPTFIAPVLFTVISVLLTTYAKDIDWGKVLSKGISYVETAREELKATPTP